MGICNCVNPSPNCTACRDFEVSFIPSTPAPNGHWETCGACGGAGQIWIPRWETWWTVYSKNTNTTTVDTDD